VRRHDHVAILPEEGTRVGGHLALRDGVEVEAGPAGLGRRQQAVVDEVGLRDQLLTGAEVERDPGGSFQLRSVFWLARMSCQTSKLSAKLQASWPSATFIVGSIGR
jgi:hypothetical protein